MASQQLVGIQYCCGLRNRHDLADHDLGQRLLQGRREETTGRNNPRQTSIVARDIEVDDSLTEPVRPDLGQRLLNGQALGQRDNILARHGRDWLTEVIRPRLLVHRRQAPIIGGTGGPARGAAQRRSRAVAAGGWSE